ncbi:MAG: polysaccharide biosynthesis/export family protein, partial [Flavobacteriales bacterium]
MRSVHGYLVALLLLASCRVQPLLRSGDARSIDELRAGDTLCAQPIRTDDKLTISVWNHDELSVGSVFTIYNTNESFGKWLLVDAHGEVPVPGVGIMKLGGLTCEQAQDTLRQRYAAQLRDPVV